MSAECEKCGANLVGSQYDEGGLSCRPCDLERQLAEAKAAIATLERTRDLLLEQKDEFRSKLRESEAAGAGMRAALMGARGIASVTLNHNASPRALEDEALRVIRVVDAALASPGSGLLDALRQVNHCELDWDGLCGECQEAVHKAMGPHVS